MTPAMLLSFTSTTIGGRDAVEEFMACKMYPLASGFGFRGVTVGTTPVLKVPTPLSVFPMEVVSVDGASRILVEIETEAKRILGSFGPKEYDAMSMAKLPNGGCLNRIFEHMGLAYAPWLLPQDRSLLGSEREMQSPSVKKTGCQKGENIGKPSGSIQNGAPAEDRHCEGGLTED
jgi:hypothetical protein